MKHALTIMDDDLSRFAAAGAAPLPQAQQSGYVEQDGARIWYSVYGSGRPVILLHGGLGHSGNWGYQLPALLSAGYQVCLIDSRGHGRSSWDGRPFNYGLMADDVLAVMDELMFPQAALVGWSDGAVIALTLALRAPDRVRGVLFFACQVDPSGAKVVNEQNPLLARCFRRHAADYAHLSPTPERFEAFVAAVNQMMTTEPDYHAAELAALTTPVAVVLGQEDEFIKEEHARYIAATIPGATFTLLPGVSHFAPLQRPALFNASMLSILDQHCRDG